MYGYVPTCAYAYKRNIQMRAHEGLSVCELSVAMVSCYFFFFEIALLHRLATQHSSIL